MQQEVEAGIEGVSDGQLKQPCFCSGSTKAQNRCNPLSYMRESEQSKSFGIHNCRDVKLKNVKRFSQRWCSDILIYTIYVYTDTLYTVQYDYWHFPVYLANIRALGDWMPPQTRGFRMVVWWFLPGEAVTAARVAEEHGNAEKNCHQTVPVLNARAFFGRNPDRKLD